MATGDPEPTLLEDSPPRGSSGFAVVDLETTGLAANHHDRVVEVAVVLLATDGTVIGEWTSLVDPRRDVGPTCVHGVRARDLVDAPEFADIAVELAGLLAGRVLVAHNLPFEVRFLRAEYGRLGCPDVPLAPDRGVCTMRLGTRYLPGAPRSLADCCAAAGWTHEDAHQALTDARAAARLLGCYLDRIDGTEDWPLLPREALSWSWPEVPAPPSARPALTRERLVAQRLSAAQRLLARLAPALPRVPDPSAAGSYLGALDDALADRKIDAAEADALVALATGLGLDRGAVETLHRSYLVSLAMAAGEDGVLTDHGRADLDDVAVLLGLPGAAVQEALRDRRDLPGRRDPWDGRGFGCGTAEVLGSLRLRSGDRICFTGEMSLSREELTARAVRAGLRVTSAVSRMTTMLVCADADSLSGKARRARELGIRMVSEPKFHQLLTTMATGS
ncbi:MAG: hypothetical protein GXX79_00840 [Actinomycetales bacterium]|nr:hypothetical protein [Actinomycetales bacterium]